MENIMPHNRVDELLEKCTNIRIYLVEKKDKHDDSVTVYSFPLSNDNKKELINDYKNNFKMYVCDREVMEYDFVDERKDVIQILKTDEIPLWSDIIKQINELSVQNTLIFQKENISPKIKMSVIECEVCNTKIYLLAKFTYKKFFSKKIHFGFSQNKFVKINSVILTLGDNIDCFVYQDKFYILIETPFNSMFDFHGRIKKSVLDHKDEVETWNFFDDNTQIFNFINGSISKSRQFIKLCKNSKNLQVFKEKSPKEIRSIIERDNVLKDKFKFDSITDKILFDKKSLTALMKLFIDDISRRYLTDETIERGKTSEEINV